MKRGCRQVAIASSGRAEGGEGVPSANGGPETCQFSRDVEARLYSSLFHFSLDFGL